MAYHCIPFIDRYLHQIPNFVQIGKLFVDGQTLRQGVLYYVDFQESTWVDLKSKYWQSLHHMLVVQQYHDTVVTELTYNSPGQSLIPKTRSFLQTEKNSSDWSSKRSGHTSSRSARHEVSLLCVRSKVLKQLFTITQQCPLCVTQLLLRCIKWRLGSPKEREDSGGKL